MKDEGSMPVWNDGSLVVIKINAAEMGSWATPSDECVCVCVCVCVHVRLDGKSPEL